jgi:Cytochrome P460
MRRILFVPVALGASAAAVAYVAPASGQAEGKAAPVCGITIPPGYRDWTMISIANVGDPVNDLRVKLGNDVAIEAYRDGALPFPDGAIIARLAYQQVTSEENNVAIRPVAEKSGLTPEQVTKLLDESFVAGPPTNVQFMVKDSKKYASTGGWGFAQFTNSKSDGEQLHNTCFSCHAPNKDRDYVFTRYAP